MAKYYATNGDKYIGMTTMYNDDNNPTPRYSVVNKDISHAWRFKYNEAVEFIKTELNNSPEWGLRKISNKSSKRNYVVTTGVNYIASGGKITNDFAQAKPFNSTADIQAYINSHREIAKYFQNLLVIDSEGNPQDLSVGRQFTPQQLEVLGLSTTARTQRIFIRKNVKNEIYERDHGICGICGKPVSKNDYTIDHIIPVCNGGSNDPDNLRITHFDCNQLKGSFEDEKMNNVVLSIAANKISKEPFGENSARIIRALVRGELSHYGYSIN